MKNKIIKLLKGIGLALLLCAMGYASNWDLPPETKEDWEAEHWEALQAYEEARQQKNGFDHVEMLEAWPGAIPEEYLTPEAIHEGRKNGN